MHPFKEIFIPPNVFDDVLLKAKHRTNDVNRSPLAGRAKEK